MAIRSIHKAFTTRAFSSVFAQIPMRRFAEGEKNEETQKPGDSTSGLSELESKIKALEKESLQYKDLYIRAVAEQENVRKRLTKEIENEGNYAITKFAKEMVEVNDNLNRAIENTKTENVEPLKSLKDLVEGVTMTKDILKNVFTKFHILEYAPLGEKFDPNFHEALFAYEDKNKEPGTVGQVLSNGFKIKDRVLRSAKVGVIKK